MKKKGFIGLSTLLLVLLLGLFTTSYASLKDDYTFEEFENIVYNIMTAKGTNAYTTQAQNIITNYQTTLQTIYNIEGDYVIGRNVNNVNGVQFLMYTNTNSTNHPYVNSGRTRVYVYNRSGATKTYYYFSGNWNFQEINSSTVSNGSEQSISPTYYVTNTPIYTSSTGGTVVYPAGISDSDLTIGPYQSEPAHAEIIFTPIPKVQDVYVGQNLDIYTYGVNQNNTYRSMKFGDLYVPSGYYITRVDSTYLFFERASQTWKEKILLQEVGTDLTLSNYSYSITNFKWENYDSSTYTIDYSAWINREYLHANCMYTFTFSGYYIDESDPFYIEYIFYIIDGNTVLTGTLGDELDPSFLITGPYADEYAGDIDDLNDKVDENADLVDAIGQGIGGTLRPASGDWFPLNNLSSGDSLLGTAQLWGFRNYANGYWDSLYAVFSNTTYTLQQTGNVQLSVSFHGYTKVLNSNDFTTPSGDLKTFISSALVMGTMFAVYKLFSRKIEKIKRADLTDIKNEAKDDSDLM